MRPMKRPFVLAGIIGVVMLAFLVALIAFFPAKANRLPDGFFSPIIAFEFVQTPQEVAAMFRAPDGTVLNGLVDTMNAINKLDFIYMVLYSMFLLVFAVSVARHSARPLFHVAAGLALVVLISDFGENLQLLAITDKIETGGFEIELVRLHILTWIKWGGIAVIFVLLFPWFIKGRAFSRLIGFIGILSFLLGVAAFLHRSVLNELFSFSVGLMFLLMVIYCLVYRRGGYG